MRLRVFQNGWPCWIELEFLLDHGINGPTSCIKIISVSFKKMCERKDGRLAISYNPLALDQYNLITTVYYTMYEHLTAACRRS